MMKQTEPPSPCACAKPMCFRIGRNSRGHWVVQDELGRRGGLFVDRAQALRFAMFENGRHPEAVIMVPGVFELDTGHAPAATHGLPLDTDALPQRRVA